MKEISLPPLKNIFVQGFSNYVYHKATSRGGRAAILIRSTNNHTWNPICITEVGATGAFIKYSRDSLQVIACYNSPPSVLFKDKMDSVLPPISQIPTIVAGNLNAKNSAWN